MMRPLVALLLAQQLSQSASMNLNEKPIIVRDEGIKKGASATTIDCVGSGITCSKDGGTMYVAVSGMGTTGTLSYFVSTTGSDDAGCTALAPCASLVRVFNDLSALHFINHAVTISVAAGTYTGNPVLNNVEANAAITITGPALTTASPTTGTATGTLTAVTLGAVTVLEDSTQAWTVNDLIGAFVTIGGVTRIVAVNTATTMTLASPFTANPVIGNNYTLQTPAVVLTSATSPTLALRLSGNVGGSSSGPLVSFTGFEILNSAASGQACRVATSNNNVTLTNSRCRQTSGTGIAINYLGGGQFTMATTSAIADGTGTGITSSGGTNSAINGALTLNPNNSLFHGAIGIRAPGGNTYSVGGSQGWTAQTSSTALTSGAIVNIGRMWRDGSGTGTPVLRCTGAGSSGGYRHISGSNQQIASSEVGWDRLLIEGCTVGIDLTLGQGNSQLSISPIGSLTCTVTGTCVAVSQGSRVKLPATLAMQDGGTDILIDGTSYTATDLTTASPTRLSNFATGSTVWQ